MIDLKERGRAKAGELWDVALEKGFFNITWSDKVCNEEVLRRVGEERTIISVRESVLRGYSFRGRVAFKLN